MRTLLSVGFVLALAIAVPGCTDNQAKADKLYQQMVDEMGKLTDAIEKGDKPGWDAAMARMRQLTQDGKKVKMTQAQDKALEAKYKPQIDQVSKRMEKAIMTGITSGRISPDDAMKLGQDMTQFGKDMEAMGK